MSRELAEFLAAPDDRSTSRSTTSGWTERRRSPSRRCSTRTARGVAVRILYNVSHPGPIPVPPPPTHVPDMLERLPVQTKRISGVPDLMHHKYAIRDGEAVLTGSAELDRGLVDAAGERDRRRPLPEVAPAYR